MKLQVQLRFWIGALVALVLVLWVLRAILLPFVVGTAIAYFLNPLVRRANRIGIGRVPATLALVGLLVLIVVMLLLVVLPIFSAQLFEFIQNLPGYVARLQRLATEENREWVEQFLGPRLPDIQRSISDLMSQGVSYLLGSITSLWSGGQALLSVFALMVITPVIVFYVLCDWDAMVDTVDSWIPLHQRPAVRRLGREMDNAVAGFVRGQGLVCLLLGSYYAMALSMAGLNFGLLIGIVSGLITFIPYVGSLTGFVLAIGVAIVQFFPDWGMIGIIFAIFIAGQTIEGYILSPKLVGDSIGVHPVWLMFALFAFGYLFGFVGLLLAVPLTAAVGVLVRFGFRQYFHSTLYTGGEQPAEERAADPT
ncbi:AI-2E family transporter [Azorhizobium oxalatiphilum]|uniref:AI-2E family transporter n=1 Tax=Azorhizobium oxalatiphilum TaxID=980631 RepID=A0A917BI76_9HYPH|nr:AI-2E family transporter [Azorhizobium oxalatiphilum]GGF45794.1 AI-2E family transporter [Azorhizobium oxalatiphilum]